MTATLAESDISVDDVDAYTGGRLSADDDETQRMLSAALAAARRYAGWHVSPVKLGDEITLDGPGRHKLRLPTQKIVGLDAIVENGVTVDLDTVTIAAQVPGLLVRHCGYWSYKYGAITVTYDHGFTADEAADWRQAILSMVDQMAGLTISGRPDSDLQSKQVDDVVYRWGTAQALPGAQPILDQYRLLGFGFA